jgi:CBS domain-containing protein
MFVSEIMTRGVECTHPETSLDEAANRMRQLDVGLLPVCDHDRLIGMVTDRDITVRATAEALDPLTSQVRDVMTPRVSWCFEDDDVRVAGQKMKDEQIRRLPVMDHNRRMVGIVSLGDIAIESGDDELTGNVLEGVSDPNRPMR